MEAAMKKLACVLCSVLAASAISVVAADSVAKKAIFGDAPAFVQASKVPVNAAALAGKRVVAVGDYGGIIYSDDGKNYAQAKVPTRAPLTSVVFVDEQRGWAAGHDGTILGTSDGGKSWSILRQQRGKEEVLLSIWFENVDHGLAVGQFGLAFETMDGGKSWSEVVLLDGEAGERHLQHVFSAGDGVLLIAAEAGTVLRSSDNGKHWKAIDTGNKGSFWVGAALPDGSLLMAGMRGHIYRSKDRGLSWAEVPSGTQQSLTGIAQSEAGVQIVGLGGVSLVSKDNGMHFDTSTRKDRASQSAVAFLNGSALYFGSTGVLAAE